MLRITIKDMMLIHKSIRKKLFRFFCKVSEYSFKVNDFDNAISDRYHCQIV